MRDRLKRNTLVNRRQLLAATVAALCGVTVARQWPTWSRSDDARALAERIVNLLGLAQARQSDLPANTDLERTLAQLLGVDTTALPLYAVLTDNALRQHLRERIECDYRQRALTPIDGWWLAATEARALKLAADLNRSALWRSA